MRGGKTWPVLPAEGGLHPTPKAAHGGKGSTRRRVVAKAERPASGAGVERTRLSSGDGARDGSARRPAAQDTCKIEGRRAMSEGG